MKLLATLAICFGAAWIGSWFTRPALFPWYASLLKPSWTPPNGIFTPVWLSLYALMAVAAWLVWRRTELGSIPLKLFAIQLLLNVAWSVLFFGLKSPAAAMAEIVFLWLAILATTISFWGIRRIAGWLLIPYLVWVTYAAMLNFAIWHLNG